MRWYSISTFLCFTALVACGIDPDSDGATTACNGPDCQGADAGAAEAAGDPVLAPPSIDVDESADSGTTEPMPDAGAITRYPVCSGLCAPDDRASCLDFDPDDPLDERSLYQNGSASLLMLRQLMEKGTDGGAPDASVDLQESEGSGGSGSASSATDGAWSCQIDRDEGEVSVGCYLSGAGADGAPCTSTRDCEGGYACVGEQGIGRCRKFCCEGDAACVTLDADQTERKYFCDERSLRSTNTAGTDGLMVPVCALADMCDLSEPFPCEDSATCCEAGKACTVVNAAGATGCRVPGEGGLDEACPCLPGFLCDPIENTCKQLCNLERAAGCGDYICQATANFPAGWGVCQSVAPETD